VSVVLSVPPPSSARKAPLALYLIASPVWIELGIASMSPSPSRS
jgi:hypothetical protein